MKKQYNPGDNTNGTSYTYDGANRVLTRRRMPTGPRSRNAYYGNLAVHRDPFGAATWQKSDALGRLIEVIEDPDPARTADITALATLEDSGGKHYVTTYTYDTLDDLSSVTQDGLATVTCGGVSVSRCFGYDSLKQLRSAYNPESGTITYDYDENGNLVTRTTGTAAETLTTSFQCDPLDRLKFRSYQGIRPRLRRSRRRRPLRGVMTARQAPAIIRVLSPAPPYPMPSGG